MMAVDIAAGPGFQPGSPHLLFKLPLEFLHFSPNPGTLADVTPDHQPFLLAMPVQESVQAVNVVLNWQGGLKR